MVTFWPRSKLLLKSLKFKGWIQALLYYVKKKIYIHLENSKSQVRKIYAAEHSWYNWEDPTMLCLLLYYDVCCKTIKTNPNVIQSLSVCGLRNPWVVLCTFTRWDVQDNVDKWPTLVLTDDVLWGRRGPCLQIDDTVQMLVPCGTGKHQRRWYSSDTSVRQTQYSPSLN